MSPDKAIELMRLALSTMSEQRQRSVMFGFSAGILAASCLEDTDELANLILREQDGEVAGRLALDYIEADARARKSRGDA